MINLKNIYQSNLESIKGSEFIIDHVHLLYYECNNINPNHRGSYIYIYIYISSKKSKNKSYQ